MWKKIGEFQLALILGFMLASWYDFNDWQGWVLVVILGISIAIHDASIEMK